jgi:glucuronoarabinoxylan endo-1,4-beta-xylanase
MRNAVLGLLFASALAACGGGGGSAASAPSAVASSPTPPAAADFTLGWTAVHQTIDGFGASDAWHGPLTAAQADLYFSPSAGIGLSLLRMGISPEGGTFSNWNNAKLAIARGAKVWAAPWSPPATLKTTGDLNSGSLRSDSYVTWAHTLASFVTAFNANVGSPLYAISAQNEPDFDTQGAYDMCLYGFPEMASFVDQLGASVAALKLASPPKILAPEAASWGKLWNYSAAINADPVAHGYVGLFATHQYGGVSPYQSLDKPVWETEQSSFEAFDPSIANALKVSGWIHEALTSGNVSAWHYWWLNGLNADNEGLTGKNGDFQLTKRLYALGHYARFVRPGWVRIDVTGSAPGLLVTAFKNPATGDFAVVVTNSGSATTRTFSIAGAAGSSVSVYVTADTPLGAIGTDGNLSLGSASQQVPASIPMAQGQFTAPVVYGITTFTGKASAP